MSDYLNKARDILEQRIAEIDVERKQLERALRSLSDAGARRQAVSGSGARSRRGRGGAIARGASGKPPRRGRRRSSGARTARAVQDYLREHPGAETSDVVQALNLKDGRIVGAQRRKLSPGKVE